MRGVTVVEEGDVEESGIGVVAVQARDCLQGPYVRAGRSLILSLWTRDGVGTAPTALRAYVPTAYKTLDQLHNSWILLGTFPVMTRAVHDVRTPSRSCIQRKMPSPRWIVLLKAGLGEDFEKSLMTSVDGVTNIKSHSHESYRPWPKGDKKRWCSVEISAGAAKARARGPSVTL